MSQSLKTAPSPLEFRPWISVPVFPKLRTIEDAQVRDGEPLDNLVLPYPASIKSVTLVSVESAIEVLMALILSFISLSISWTATRTAESGVLPGGGAGRAVISCSSEALLWCWWCWWSSSSSREAVTSPFFHTRVYSINLNSCSEKKTYFKCNDEALNGAHLQTEPCILKLINLLLYFLVRVVLSSF